MPVPQAVIKEIPLPVDPVVRRQKTFPVFHGGLDSRLARKRDDGVLMMGPSGEAERLQYRLAGETLTVVSDGESSTWRRVGGSPKSQETPVTNEQTQDDARNSQITKATPEKTKPTKTGATIFKEHKLTDPAVNSQNWQRIEAKD